MQREGGKVNLTVGGTGLGIRSFAHSLKIAHIIERLWAIFSCRSEQKSDHEQFAQAAHEKRATVRELLSSLCKKSNMSDTSKSLSKMFLAVVHCFFFFYGQEHLAPTALHSVALF